MGRACRGQTRGRGSDALKPTVPRPFVEEDAAVDDVVPRKCTRRLQHFIDRKVATLFEPLLATCSHDEALTGLATRLWLSSMLEGLRRAATRRASQSRCEGRSIRMRAAQLRKHGVRFGQYTVFMPLLLKPAPTRVCGSVLVVAVERISTEFPGGAAAGPRHRARARKACAGQRITRPCQVIANRRSARDPHRHARTPCRPCCAVKIAAAASKPHPDMLSITGMTLEQFAELLQGLGYQRRKRRAGEGQGAPHRSRRLKTPAARSDR